MKGKILVISFGFLMLLIFIVIGVVNKKPILESTTQTIHVVSKEREADTSEQWITSSSNKKIYVDDFSTWALIQVNGNYTVIYDLMKKSGRYNLRTIVPEDYNGQF